MIPVGILNGACKTCGRKLDFSGGEGLTRSKDDLWYHDKCLRPDVPCADRPRTPPEAQRIYLVWHEYQDSGLDWDTPAWHSNVVKAFRTQALAEAFVKHKAYHELDHYVWGSVELE
jgi:hypothetical protein